MVRGRDGKCVDLPLVPSRPSRQTGTGPRLRGVRTGFKGAMRGTPLVIGLALLFLAGSGGPRRVRAQGQASLLDNAGRAAATYLALQANFYVPERGLYRETYPDQAANPYSYLWPYSQALAATLDVAAIPDPGGRYQRDVLDRLDGLTPYWDAAAEPPCYASYILPPLGRGGDRYYDDNAWLGIELARLYRVTGNPLALSRARQAFDFVVSGWDTDPSHPAPGGVFWLDAAWNRDRNTASTGPGAMLGLYLYRLTGESYYFNRAKDMYDWTNQYLLAPNGLYWDHIALDGTIDTTFRGYNQGSMIGANVLLYRATGDASYLRRAEQLADTALQFYAGGFGAQPPIFNALFFKGLMLLDAESQNPAYRQAMQAYADEVWNTRRESATNLFIFDPASAVTLLNQAAMIQIYAALAQLTPLPLS